MEELLLQAPIPGQSLTDEPKNFPWENPSELTDFNEALRYHLDRVSNNPEVLEDLYTLIEIGYPLKSLAESMTSVAVMEGIHSIDVSLAITPLIYQELVEIAKEADLDFVSGLEENALAKQEKQDQTLEAQLRRELNKMENEIGAEGYDDSLLEDALDFLSDSEPEYNTIEDMDATNIEELENIDRTRELNPDFDKLSPLLDPEFKPPQERGPMYPFPKGSDKNPIMAGNGLMSRRTV